MNVPPSPLSSHDPSPLQATTRSAAQSQAPPPSQRPRNLWLGLVHWFQQNTFAPQWLPGPMRHPFIGYLIAVLLELAAASLLLLLLSLFPSFAFRGILVVVMVALIALGWGAGPSLFATLVGTFLLYYAVLPPHFSWILADPVDSLGVVLYLVVGSSISLLAGQSERARRQIEAQHRFLKQVEARSHVDVQRLRAVLDVLPSAVAIADAQGRLLEMNQATRTLWGEQAPLVAGIAQYALYKGWRSRTGTLLAAEDWAMARALTKGEVSLNEELEIETFDGQRKTILHSAVPIRDETGAIIGGVVNAQDISVVRHLEREVAERAAELEALFEAITDGIALTDAEGRLRQTNRAFRTLLGVEQHPDYATSSMQERLAKLALRNEQGEMLSVDEWLPMRLLQGETLVGVDTRITTLEGREIVVNVSGAPLRDKMGHLAGCVEVFRDVTERRHQEQRTHDALNALVAMGEALVQVHQMAKSSESAGAAPPGAEATLPLVARRLAELTQSVLGCRCVSITAVEAATGLLCPITVVGLPPEQEHAWWARWSPPPRLEEHADAALAALFAGEPVPLETWQPPERTDSPLFPVPTGRILPMRMGEELVGILFVEYGEHERVVPSREEMLLTGTIARLGALVLERDRLLRRWAEALASVLALQETKVQMDTFLGIVSHELKTPLTTIKLGLQVIERRLRAFARHQAAPETGEASALERFLEQLASTVEQVDRLERLVDDLIDVSRVEAGRLELRPEDTDLMAIVREAVEAQRQIHSDRPISFQGPADRPVPVYADRGRVEQVITNYLTNALKYSPAERPVAVGVEVEAQRARVWVRDQGPGLSAAEQERIWERFYRVKGIEVQSGKGVGLGLGLHICRTIIERHQGQVGVESAPGEGSIFWFTLPLGHPRAPEQ